MTYLNLILTNSPLWKAELPEELRELMTSSYVLIREKIIELRAWIKSVHKKEWRFLQIIQQQLPKKKVRLVCWKSSSRFLKYFSNSDWNNMAIFVTKTWTKSIVVYFWFKIHHWFLLWWNRSRLCGMNERVHATKAKVYSYPIQNFYLFEIQKYPLKFSQDPSFPTKSRMQWRCLVKKEGCIIFELS